jgi:hypothetical protein
MTTLKDTNNVINEQTFLMFFLKILLFSALIPTIIKAFEGLKASFSVVEFSVQSLGGIIRFESSHSYGHMLVKFAIKLC